MSETYILVPRSLTDSMAHLLFEVSNGISPETHKDRAKEIFKKYNDLVNGKLETMEVPINE